MNGRSPASFGWGLVTHAQRRTWIFFYASTTITVGNGAKTPFWDSPWLLGRKPKDIAPLIFGASKKKNWKVHETLKGNAWILKIKIDTPVTAAIVHEFFSLWMFVNEVHLDEHAEDDITWKHSSDGIYSNSLG